MKKDRQDVTGGKNVKDKNQIMDRWKEYFMVLLNEHNDYKINETAIKGNHRG